MLKVNLTRVAIVPVAFALVFAISAPASAKKKAHPTYDQAWAICATSSSVIGAATQTGPTWLYDFTVFNGCAPDHQQLLTDFYIPYFADAGIGNITLPAPDTTSTTSTITWTDTIEPNNDLFDLLGAGVIDFHVTASPDLEVGPDQFAAGVGYYAASGFSFTSDFAPVEGPYSICSRCPQTT